MSANVDLNVRPDYDDVIKEIADYVRIEEHSQHFHSMYLDFSVLSVRVLLILHDTKCSIKHLIAEQVDECITVS